MLEGQRQKKKKKITAVVMYLLYSLFRVGNFGRLQFQRNSGFCSLS